MRNRHYFYGIGNEFTTYNELVDHPLAEAQTIQDVEEYPWPSADWLSVSHIKDAVRQVNDDERRAIVIATGEFLDIAWGMRGIEQFLIDMVTQPELAQAILCRVVALCRRFPVYPVV